MINTIIFIFLGTIGWGTSYLFVKLLLSSLLPAELIFYRMCIGGMTLFILIKLLKIKFTNVKKLIKDGVIVGLFNIAIPFYLTTVAQKNIDSSLSSVINGFTPLFTLLIGVSLFASKEKINSMVVVSIILGMAGLLLININIINSHQPLLNIGALLLSSVSYAIAANYIRSSTRANHSLWVAVVAIVFTAIVMLVIKIQFETPLRWHYPENTIQSFILLWLGVMSTGVCMYLYCLLIQRSGATMAAMVTYLMTMTAVIAGVYILNEHMTGLTLLGCSSIVLSLLIINHAHLLQRILSRLRG